MHKENTLDASEGYPAQIIKLLKTNKEEKVLSGISTVERQQKCRPDNNGLLWMVYNMYVRMYACIYVDISDQ